MYQKLGYKFVAGADEHIYIYSFFVAVLIIYLKISYQHLGETG
jgi:hypothetical protein